MGAPYIYDISRLRVKDLHSATYIYVVRRLRVKLQDGARFLQRIIKGVSFIFFPIAAASSHRKPAKFLCYTTINFFPNAAILFVRH